MKKAIFRSFIFILLLALILSGSIFGVVINKIILDKTEENMLYSIRIADSGLNYKGDLKAQLDRLKYIEGNEKARFTIIDLKGKVLADSDIADASVMKNHKNREEVKAALQNGFGYSIRKSETLNEDMMYVAGLSANGSYIVRMAIPFSGLSQYAVSFIPAIIISTGISMLISLILAERFASSVTKPLNEIAEEMLKIGNDKPNFLYKHYEYPEMNVIAETTLNMTQAIKESMDRIEFERMIRQEFFSNASHELKTPLTSIHGYVELLENDMAANETMKKDFLKRIKKETNNMTNLINDILMISRLETKEAEVIMEEIRISLLLNEVVVSLEPLAQEYQVQLNTSCKPIVMTANAQQIRELLGNLVTNAIKYNKPGGKVDVTVTTETKEMVIVVEDTGVGIPQDAIQRIFERFYRVDKGRSKKVGGTGLGLSIVKHIVNYYNGTVEVQSRLNEGSKFTVRLPL